MKTATIGLKCKCFFLVLAFFAGMPCAGSADCLDPSPTVVAGKDPYAAIAVRGLTPLEHDTIKTLFKFLDGEWLGSASTLECRGLKDPDNNRQQTYTAKAEVEADYYGNFFLRMTLYSPEKRTTHQKILRLYLSADRLRVNTSSSAGDVELIYVGNNRIAFLYRLLLQSNTSQGSIRKEIFIALETRNGMFSLEQQTYSQGRLSAEEIRRFTRR